jgi:hypothetical protein
MLKARDERAVRSAAFPVPSNFVRSSSHTAKPASAGGTCPARATRHRARTGPRTLARHASRVFRTRRTGRRPRARPRCDRVLVGAASRHGVLRGRLCAARLHWASGIPLTRTPTNGVSCCGGRRGAGRPERQPGDPRGRHLQSIASRRMPPWGPEVRSLTAGPGASVSRA